MVASTLTRASVPLPLAQPPQALQCCLGVSARSTGRSNNLAGLIRTGCTEAKVRVTLWNTGDDAFQPTVYGDRITIERIIKPNNGGDYRHAKQSP